MENNSVTLVGIKVLLYDKLRESIQRMGKYVYICIEQILVNQTVHARTI